MPPLKRESRGPAPTTADRTEFNRRNWWVKAGRSGSSTWIGCGRLGRKPVFALYRAEGKVEPTSAVSSSLLRCCLGSGGRGSRRAVHGDYWGESGSGGLALPPRPSLGPPVTWNLRSGNGTSALRSDTPDAIGLTPQRASVAHAAVLGKMQLAASVKSTDARKQLALRAFGRPHRRNETQFANLLRSHRPVHSRDRRYSTDSAWLSTDTKKAPSGVRRFRCSQEQPTQSLPTRNMYQPDRTAMRLR